MTELMSYTHSELLRGLFFYQFLLSHTVGSNFFLKKIKIAQPRPVCQPSICNATCHLLVNNGHWGMFTCCSVSPLSHCEDSWNIRSNWLETFLSYNNMTHVNFFPLQQDLWWVWYLGYTEGGGREKATRQRAHVKIHIRSEWPSKWHRCARSPNS